MRNSSGYTPAYGNKLNKVQKLRHEIIIKMFDGEVFCGRIFTGFNERPLDVINDQRDFLPIELMTNEIIIVSKKAIMLIDALDRTSHKSAKFTTDITQSVLYTKNHCTPNLSPEQNTNLNREAITKNDYHPLAHNTTNQDDHDTDDISDTTESTFENKNNFVEQEDNISATNDYLLQLESYVAGSLKTKKNSELPVPPQNQLDTKKNHEEITKVLNSSLFLLKRSQDAEFNKKVVDLINEIDKK